MQALITSIEPTHDSSGLILSLLRNMGVDAFVKDFSPLNLAITLLSVLTILDVILRIFQSYISRSILWKVVYDVQKPYDAGAIAEKERLISAIITILKAFELSLFCLIIVIGVSFLSVSLSFILGASGIALIVLSLYMQGIRAGMKEALVRKRKNYEISAKRKKAGIEKMDELWKEYLRSSIELRSWVDVTNTAMGALQGGALIAIVILISYMDFPPAIIALPIVLVLSVRRFISSGRSAAAKLANLAEKKRLSETVKES